MLNTGLSTENVDNPVFNTPDKIAPLFPYAMEQQNRNIRGVVKQTVLLVYTIESQLTCFALFNLQIPIEIFMRPDGLKINESNTVIKCVTQQIHLPFTVKLKNT